MTTAKWEAVKVAAKPPLKSEFGFWLSCGVLLNSRWLVLILGGDFFSGATVLTKLILRFDELTDDSAASHALRAEVCHSSFVR